MGDALWLTLQDCDRGWCSVLSEELKGHKRHWRKPSAQVHMPQTDRASTQPSQQCPCCPLTSAPCPLLCPLYAGLQVWGLRRIPAHCTINEKESWPVGILRVVREVEATCMRHTPTELRPDVRYTGPVPHLWPPKTSCLPSYSWWTNTDVRL